MFLCHHEIYFMSFYIRNSINFMSLIIHSHNLYINLMFYDITKFILCHFILEI